MSYDKDIREGDIVQLKKGYTDIKLTEISGRGAYAHVYGRYVKSGSCMQSFGVVYYLKDLKFIRRNETATKEKTMANPTKGTLFSIIGTENEFGTYLTRDGKGRYVLEMKPTGDIKAYDKKAIAEVVPYTVNVKFNGTAKVYSYLSSEGKVAKGDLIIVKNSDNIARVVDINTKSPGATKELEGRKVVTEKI